MGNNISYQTAEYGKFLQLGADTAFPPISVIRWSYPDTSSAFPENSGMGPLSSVDVYPKYAVLTHLTNPDDIKISLSAENINVSLGYLEDLTNIQNGILLLQSYQLSGITGYIDDLEENTFDTASAVDDVYHELVDFKNRGIKYADTPNLDAFGRLRISTPTSLFDSKSIYDSSRFFWNTRQRDGTEIFLANDSSRFATVTASNGFFVKETYRRFAYQPGKSQLLMFTGVLSAEEDIIKRVGIFSTLSGNDYFEEPVGIYFQVYKTSGMNDNESYAWVINNASNLVPSQSAVQIDWNVDKMDGTGPSGITLDFSKTQIFFTDFEWLGVGRVRCGFNVNGVNYICHEFLNANNTNGTYIINPNLPIRAELRSTGASYGSMKTICSSIASEGGVENPAFITRSAYLSASLNPAIGNRRGILGIRLNPLRANGAQEVIDVNIMPEVTQQNVFAPYRWELVMRPTPATGRTWLGVDGGDEGNIQYAQGATNLQITGGTTVASGFANREVTINLNKTTYDKSLRLGVDLDGITDELWIVVTPIAQNVPLWASITVAETD